MTNINKPGCLLPDGCSCVVCALSGGADSVYLLKKVAEESHFRGIKLVAAHYNHGLRGAESDADEKFAKNLCSAAGISFVSEKGDVQSYAKENKLGVEEAARALRYEFLEQTADSVGAEYILTAHTADDNAETMLLNLARGTGLNGLCGIKRSRGRILRPILDVTREQIEEFLKSNGIEFVEDSSNALDIYNRNLIRHKIIPVLCQINPEFIRASKRASDLLMDDEAFLEGEAEKFTNKHGKNSLPCTELLELPRAVSSRVLRRACPSKLEEKHILAILSLCTGEGLGYADLPSAVRAKRQNGKISFKQGAEMRFIDTLVPKFGSVKINGTETELKVEEVRYNIEVNKSFNTFFFHCDSICGNILCTSAQAGDKIRLLGRGCTKKLSDLYGEKKLSMAERRLNPVFRDDCGILGVCGFGTAERCAPQHGERALKIEIIP